VNLIGEHLDYNGGEVLPMAIASRTWVAMSPAHGGMSKVISSTEEDTGMFESPLKGRAGRWWDYVSGLGSLPGRTVPPAEIAVWSDVPSGAGLSSSAALEVAAGLAYAALSETEPDLRRIALDGWRVENEFVGVSSGIMDQFASALSTEGHALHIWCDTTETEHVPFSATVLIFDTGLEPAWRGAGFVDCPRVTCGAGLDGSPQSRNKRSSITRRGVLPLPPLSLESVSINH
jgi:galactokinase